MARTLLEAHPDIATDWDADANGELTPNDVSATSKIPVTWKCPFGHQYKVSTHTRVRTSGCKFCHRGALAESVRRARLAKSISFAQAHPELVGQWDFSKNTLDPSSVSLRSKLKVWWRCEEGHEWVTTPQARSIGRGCPTCEILSRGARVRADRLRKGGKSFADVYPELLVEWDYKKNTLSPTEISPKSNVRASWKCKFGHAWERSNLNVRNTSFHIVPPFVRHPRNRLAQSVSNLLKPSSQLGCLVPAMGIDGIAPIAEHPQSGFDVPVQI